MYRLLSLMLMLIMCTNVCLPIQSQIPEEYSYSTTVKFGNDYIVYDNDVPLIIFKNISASHTDTNVGEVYKLMRNNTICLSEYVEYENDCKHYSKQISEYLESYGIKCDVMIVSFTNTSTHHMFNSVPLSNGSTIYIESTNHNTYYYFNDPYLFYNNVKEIYNVYETKI